MTKKKKLRMPENGNLQTSSWFISTYTEGYF